MGNKPSVKSHLDNAQRTGVFQLKNAKLSEIPVEIFQLRMLRSIDFSSNKIKEIPSAFVCFSNLRTLLIESNHLSSLPEQLCQLTKLEMISFSSNQLTRLPNNFDQLQSLRSLNLAENRLSSFPLQICSLKQLDFVNLSMNKIREVPDGVSQLQACEVNLNQNQLVRLSDDLASCPRLKVLRLEENCLPLEELSRKILSDSNISLLTIDGNLFDMKQLQEAPGYELYMERYTATKKKM